MNVIRYITGAELPPLGWIDSKGEPLKMDRWKPISNREPNYAISKPWGGLWTAPILEDGRTAWQHWCRDNEFELSGGGELVRVVPRASAKVVVIDTHDDLLAVLDRFTEPVAAAFYRRLEINMFSVIDFAAMAECYDAIYLTAEGEWATRLTHPGLYGWDCATVLWLQPAIEEITP